MIRFQEKKSKYKKGPKKTSNGHWHGLDSETERERKRENKECQKKKIG
jgi:hypothetical protein